MALMITNLTSRPIYIPFHNGENLRLQAGGQAGPVDEVELKGNARFEKLLYGRMLAVKIAPEVELLENSPEAAAGEEPESAGESAAPTVAAAQAPATQTAAPQPVAPKLRATDAAQDVQVIDGGDSPVDSSKVKANKPSKLD